jgi:hypothetical protein
MQYMSDQFAKRTAALNIRRLVGRTRLSYDHARAESFNAALKVESGQNRDACPRNAPTSTD